MIERNTMPKLFTVQRRLFWLAVTILVVSHSAFAQTPANIKIRNAIASPNTVQDQQTGWTITVVFDTNFDLNNATEVAAAKTASNYKVININTNQTIPLSAPEVVDSVLMISNRVRLTVSMTTPSLNTTDLFHLYAFNLTFDTSPPQAPLQSPLMVQKPEQDQAGDADEELPGPRWV
jgi:hypothetical protein